MNSNRRRRKFIRADLQLKIVFIALFVSSLVLLVNFQMSLATLWSLSSGPAMTVETALNKIQFELMKKFLIAVGMAIPLSITVGILYSFKFSGPIHKFKKYFLDMTTGRWDAKCSLRKGDDLVDVSDAINAGVAVLRERISESHIALQEARAVLDEVSYTVDENARGRIRALREKIDREERVWKERFPAPEPDPARCAGAASPGAPAPDPAPAAQAPVARAE